MFSNLNGLGDLSLLFLRFGIAASFIFHGSQKLAMWKASPSEQLTEGMLKMLRALSIIEPIGGILLVFGLFTQPIAIIFGIIMIGAIVLKTTKMKVAYGKPGGWELDVVLLAGCLPLFAIGGGAFGLDQLIF